MNETGFTIVPEILDKASVERIGHLCDKIEIDGAGSRNLMNLQWVRDLSQTIQEHPTINSLLPENAISVQCTYFRKSHDTNWLVPMHRDMSIPVQSKFHLEGWDGWSRKEGLWYVRPPSQILEKLIAVRIHLEENTASNGALQVVPGSHKWLNLSEPREICEIPSGGALVMSPQILHASSKASKGERRVLHFLYGPNKLPSPAVWANAM